MKKLIFLLFILSFNKISFGQDIELKPLDSVLIMNDHFFEFKMVLYNNSSDTLSFLNIKDYSFVDAIPNEKNLYNKLNNDATSQWQVSLKDSNKNIVRPYSGLALESEYRYKVIHNIKHEEAKKWAKYHNLKLLEDKFDEIDRYAEYISQVTLAPGEKDTLRLKFPLIDQYLGYFENGKTYYLTVYFITSEKFLEYCYTELYDKIFTGIIKSKPIKLISGIEDKVEIDFDY